MTERILVTGGAGYVGSHACKAVRAAGFEPVTYDNLFRGHRWAVKWGPLEVGDITDAARLREVLRRHKPAAVMHFAALAYAGESVNKPAEYRRTNVDGSRALLEAMGAEGVCDLVFSSTCALYGQCDQPTIRESTPFNPVSPYGETKLAIERMLGAAAQAQGLRSISLRYFNAAGCDPDGETGEVHEPETHLIPLALQVAKGQRPHLEIYGDDYATPDGTCVRDYIHVSDLAEAHVLALKGLLQETPRDARGDKAPGYAKAYNLGTGHGHSVKQVIETARRVTGRPIKAVIKPRRPGDPPYAVADASLSKRELGWTPKLASLETILETAWRWEQRR